MKAVTRWPISISVWDYGCGTIGGCGVVLGYKNTVSNAVSDILMICRAQFWNTTGIIFTVSTIHGELLTKRPTNPNQNSAKTIRLWTSKNFVSFACRWARWRRILTHQPANHWHRTASRADAELVWDCEGEVWEETEMIILCLNNEITTIHLIKSLLFSYWKKYFTYMLNNRIKTLSLPRFQKG